MFSRKIAQPLFRPRRTLQLRAPNTPSTACCAKQHIRPKLCARAQQRSKLLPYQAPTCTHMYLFYFVFFSIISIRFLIYWCCIDLIYPTYGIYLCDISFIDILSPSFFIHWQWLTSYCLDFLSVCGYRIDLKFHVLISHRRWGRYPYPSLLLLMLTVYYLMLCQRSTDPNEKTPTDIFAAVVGCAAKPLIFRTEPTFLGNTWNTST